MCHFRTHQEMRGETEEVLHVQQSSLDLAGAGAAAIALFGAAATRRRDGGDKARYDSQGYFLREVSEKMILEVHECRVVNLIRHFSREEVIQFFKE